MDKLKMHSPDLSQENIAKIRELFPGCVTEARDDKTGKLRLAVDFDQLKQELSDHIVEGPQERYRLDWPGKREALINANAPIAKTLRPNPDESLNFSETKNLFIEGDNLDSLKLLQQIYLGAVKMIYIDPPYNTGNDFVYSDRFAQGSDEYMKASNQKDAEGNRLVANLSANGRFHSDWMSMIYPRLRIAKNLLSPDGIIFISIDEGEVSNLKLICDEIFGPDNFVEQIAWKNKYGSGALSKGFANVHEYVLVYTRGEFSSIAAPLDDEQRAAYRLRDDNYEVRGGYITQPLATNSKDERQNLRYPIYHEGQEIWPEKQWIWSKDRFDKAYAQGEIVINERNGKYSVRSKQYLRDENGVERLGKPISLINGPFNQDGTKEIKELFSAPVFGFPKPTKLVEYFASFVVNEKEDKDFIFMDFFAGSCSSAQAVLQLNARDGGNRRFIMVQLDEPCADGSDARKEGYETIPELSRERIRRAGTKVIEGECHPNWNRDVGFRVLKVDTSNMKDVYYRPDQLSQADLFELVDNVKPDRTAEDLLFQVLVDWGVDLTLPIRRETLQGKTVFFVDDNALVACFDQGISEELVKELAKAEPLRVVFRDNGFASDALKINVEQIFRQLSPSTELKTL
jgi:Adenine specific DNA methylase Mod